MSEENVEIVRRAYEMLNRYCPAASRASASV
jgi:hypothetical protein